MTSASIATWMVCRPVRSTGTPSSRAAAEICRASATSRSLSPPSPSRSQPHRHAVRPEVDVGVMVRGVGQPADRVHQRDARREGPGAEVRARVVPHDPPVGLVEPLRCDRFAHSPLLEMWCVSFRRYPPPSTNEPRSNQAAQLTDQAPSRRCDVTSRLDLTRPQILAFRRHVGALDERLPRGLALAPACGVGGPAGQHAPSRAPLDPCARRGDRAVHLGGPVARPALGAAVSAPTSSRHATSRSSRSGGCRTMRKRPADGRGPGRSPARLPRRRADEVRRGRAARSACIPTRCGTPRRPARS